MNELIESFIGGTCVGVAGVLIAWLLLRFLDWRDHRKERAA